MEKNRTADTKNRLVF